MPQPSRLVLKYQPAPVWVQVPLIAALVFVFTFFLSTFLNFKPGAGNPEETTLAAAILFFLAALSAMLALLVKLVLEDKILLDAGAITLPAHLTLVTFADIRLKARFPWAHLSKVALEEPADGEPAPQTGDTSLPAGGRLVFYFDSPASVRVHLKYLAARDLDRLLAAVDSNCQGRDVICQEVRDCSRHLLSAGSRAAIEGGRSDDSYTALWMQELKDQSTIATFTPRARGALLQNGRLQIIGQIASGGFSAIYLARTVGGKKVIVKESRWPARTAPGGADRNREFFQREARLLLALDHPGIVRVLDHFFEDERDYLLIEYIEGESLRQLVGRQGPQPPQAVLNWAYQIAGILSYLHGQNPPVLHRDVTPDNLILRSDSKLFLIDFGAANEFVGTATGTLIGKQAYVAPEQFRGKAQPASDLYALGATMHFLLTGSDPEALSISHPAQINKQLGSDIDNLVACLTQAEPSHRIASAEELQQKLKQLRLALSGGKVEILEPLADTAS